MSNLDSLAKASSSAGAGNIGPNTASPSDGEQEAKTLFDGLFALMHQSGTELEGSKEAVDGGAGPQLAPRGVSDSMLSAAATFMASAALNSDVSKDAASMEGATDLAVSDLDAGIASIAAHLPHCLLYTSDAADE